MPKMPGKSASTLGSAAGVCSLGLPVKAVGRLTPRTATLRLYQAPDQPLTSRALMRPRWLRCAAARVRSSTMTRALKSERVVGKCAPTPVIDAATEWATTQRVLESISA